MLVFVLVLVTFPGVIGLDAFSRSTIFIADVCAKSRGEITGGQITH